MFVEKAPSFMSSMLTGPSPHVCLTFYNDHASFQRKWLKVWMSVALPGGDSRDAQRL
jgi:hypothetical protein